MKLGITSWNPLVTLAVWTGWFPTPLIAGFWGMFSSRVLIAAVELGVFEFLAPRPRSAEEISRALELDPIGTESLLNALNGFGYVRRSGGRYRNSRTVRRWLQSDARVPLDAAFGLYSVLWDEIGDMEERLRSGASRDFHADRDSAFWQRYETGLAQFARLTGSEIARKVDLSTPPSRLLDVGGGHGTYSMRFCSRYPDLHAEVLDLPGAAAVGRGLVEAAGLSDRITFREGDLQSEEWGSGYDVVLLFNVVHIFTPEQCVELFSRAHAALRPGGTFAVLDSAHRGGTGDIDAAGGANELLFWTINNTRAYPEQDVADWMHATGFSSVRARHLLTVPQAALTTGRA